jgi:hypothetical protein
LVAKDIMTFIQSQIKSTDMIVDALLALEDFLSHNWLVADKEPLKA